MTKKNTTTNANTSGGSTRQGAKYIAAKRRLFYGGDANNNASTAAASITKSPPPSSLPSEPSGKSQSVGGGGLSRGREDIDAKQRIFGTGGSTKVTTTSPASPPVAATAKNGGRRQGQQGLHDILAKRQLFDQGSTHANATTASPTTSVDDNVDDDAQTKELKEEGRKVSGLNQGKSQGREEKLRFFRGKGITATSTSFPTTTRNSGSDYSGSDYGTTTASIPSPTSDNNIPSRPGAYSGDGQRTDAYDKRQHQTAVLSAASTVAAPKPELNVTTTPCPYLSVAEEEADGVEMQKLPASKQFMAVARPILDDDDDNHLAKATAIEVDPQELADSQMKRKKARECRLCGAGVILVALLTIVISL